MYSLTVQLIECSFYLILLKERKFSLDKERERHNEHEKTGKDETLDNSNKKQEQLDEFRIDDTKGDLTTNQGLRMAEDEFSLKAGERGPTLMEDFHFREKITHFDHERIPERIVHARRFGAHGVFESYGAAESRIVFKSEVFTRRQKDPFICSFFNC